MKKRSILGIVAVLVMAVPSLAMAAPVSAETGMDLWTVMVYMDGDNNLEGATVADLAELMAVGSSDQVNFVVLVDTLKGPAELLYVNQGGTTLLAAWGEVNMGDPATLQRFITDTRDLYPAENYALDLWNHGSGIMGVCWDDSSGGDKLTMYEMRYAIAGAGEAIDVVIFDACYMAQAEVAHQLQGYASYVVASQETVWGYGFPYDAVAAELVSNPGMDARSFALMAAEEFTAFYDDLGWKACTISVYDMAHVTTVSDAVAGFASAMVPTMAADYRTYKTCRQKAESAGGAVDLQGFAELVSANSKLNAAVRAAAGEVVVAVGAAVIYEWHSADCDGMNGLGIWFPTNSINYYWSTSMQTMYRGLLFDAATGWADFLDSYYNKG